LRGAELLCAKIGIPRSLFYYRFITFWEKFFTELGAEVVVSEQTNKRILDDGVKACVDEACLPIKLFYGHVINLKDRVDYILVPRFTSISKKEYICPEFGGLPDMVRHTLKDIPPLIDTEVNMRNSKRGGVRAAVQTGAMLGVDRLTSVRAYRAALDHLLRGDGSHVSAGRVVDDGSQAVEDFLQWRKGENRPQRIAVIGHPYNIYDRYISMDLLGKLAKYGIEVRTIETVSDGEINEQAARLEKPMFWNYGRRAYGAAMHMAQAGLVDGFICVTSFGCGIDSFVNDLIERNIRKKYNIPFITMTIDEHSGEAGFNTRLEAFVDMLRWRNRDEDHISAFG
jgi:predicted nucleotide-binding protein (sugar kinase/HSP70/actin superfamily)